VDSRSGIAPQRQIDARSKWIAALRAGGNPFARDVLETLQDK
jgi:hypothetical protein